MKKLVVAVIAAAFLVGACGGSTVVRDDATYRAELTWMEQASKQPAEKLALWVQNYCDCDRGQFTTPLCHKSADLIQVIRARLSWHKHMMLFNAGLLKNRPPVKAPVIPPAADLCPTRGD